MLRAAPREEGGRQDRGTGVDERHHLAFAAPHKSAVGRHREIAAPAIADAERRGREQEERVHAGAIEGLGEPGKIGFYAIDPDRIRIDVEERTVAQLGSALTTPPPVPRSSLRSSEMTIFGCRRCARWRSI